MMSPSLIHRATVLRLPSWLEQPSRRRQKSIEAHTRRSQPRPPPNAHTADTHIGPAPQPLERRQWTTEVQDQHTRARAHTLCPSGTKSNIDQKSSWLLDILKSKFLRCLQQTHSSITIRVRYGATSGAVAGGWMRMTSELPRAAQVCARTPRGSCTLHSSSGLCVFKLSPWWNRACTIHR